MSQRCEGGGSTAAPGGSTSTTQPTLQRPSRSNRPKPAPFSDEQYGYTGVLSRKDFNLRKTEPSDASSAAPPRPPRRSTGARPARPAKPAKLTEEPKPKAKVCRPSRSQPPHPVATKNFVIKKKSGVTNSFLHQKCLFLCVEDELRAWNVDVHCRSLVRFWTARLKKHGADNGSNPYCHYGDEKKVAHEIRRLQNHDNLGEESIIVLAQLLDASITVFEINPLGNVTINDGSGKSGTNYLTMRRLQRRTRCADKDLPLAIWLKQLV